MSPASRIPPVRVVVADDAPGLRELVCLLLEVEDDFEVVGQAANGAEAVRVAMSARPDLVLLDLEMPEMNGLEALARLRVEMPCATVVLYSGAQTPGLADRAREGGAADYVEKSVGVPELIERLRRASAERQRATG